MPAPLPKALGFQCFLDFLNLTLVHSNLAFVIAARCRGHGLANQEDPEGIAGGGVVLGLRNGGKALLLLEQLMGELLSILVIIGFHRNIGRRNCVWPLCA